MDHAAIRLAHGRDVAAKLVAAAKVIAATPVPNTPDAIKARDEAVALRIEKAKLHDPMVEVDL